MLLSNCAVRKSKKLRFIKELESRGLLNTLGMKTPFRIIPLVGPLSIFSVNTHGFFFERQKRYYSY